MGLLACMYDKLRCLWFFVKGVFYVVARTDSILGAKLFIRWIFDEISCIVFQRTLICWVVSSLAWVVVAPWPACLFFCKIYFLTNLDSSSLEVGDVNTSVMTFRHLLAALYYAFYWWRRFITFCIIFIMVVRSATGEITSVPVWLSSPAIFM